MFQLIRTLKLYSVRKQRLVNMMVFMRFGSWDSIIAESLIFDNKDIKGLSDDELKRMVKSSEIFKIGSDVLVKRSGTGYTFVNYINKLS